MTSRQLEQTLMSDIGALGIYHNYGSVRLGKVLSQPGQYEQLYLAKNYKKRV
jgi:hypothetical protein